MARSRWGRAARWIASIVLCGSLAGCGGGGSGQTPFDLTAAPPRPQHVMRAKIRVAPPAAAGELDSDRILVRTGPNDLAVLAGARWSDRLPAVLQGRLNAAFDNAGNAPADDAEDYAYILETDVRAFELLASSREVDIDIAVKLVSARTGRVVANRTFKARAPVASTEAPAVTAVLDGAFEGVMAKIVAFAASTR
jgi:cholesterol transport system auxiliary component